MYLDDCQFSNDNWYHRNRIKTPQGICRLQVPLEMHFGDLINQIRTKDELNWREKHLKTIRMNYAKASHFDEIYPEFEALLMTGYSSLADMNMAIDTWMIRSFGFDLPITKSSDLPIHTLSETRVMDICDLYHTDIYLSGYGAANYQVEEHFTQRGIQLQYYDFKAPEYPQLWKKAGFIPNLSAIDYIFNCGFDWEPIEKAML